MNEQELYNLALKMLVETNIYHRSIEDFIYTYNHYEYNLISILVYKIKSVMERYAHICIDDKEIAYKAIKYSLLEYIEEYPGSYSFKQNTREKFGLWLENIRNKYNISDNDLEDFIINPNDKDVAITLVKALHNRDWVTKQDLQYKVDFRSKDTRGIRKSLRKLCWKLVDCDCEDVEKKYPHYKIGGQPITVDIQTKEIGQTKYYRTNNTLHPLILQENMMQVGTLLQSLARNYYEYENHVSYTIALDIWSQLSDYAKERVEEVYARNDDTVEDFIALLKDECPDNHSCLYHTDRDMLLDMIKNEDANNKTILEFLEKHRRTFSMVYTNDRNENIVLSNLNVRIYAYDNNNVYKFISDYKLVLTLDEEDLYIIKDITDL